MYIVEVYELDKTGLMKWNPVHLADNKKEAEDAKKSAIRNNIGKQIRIRNLKY